MWDTEKRCIDCGRYNEQGCYRGMYFDPKKGKIVFNYKNLKEERKSGAFISFFTGKCGQQGRFFKWRI